MGKTHNRTIGWRHKNLILISKQQVTAKSSNYKYISSTITINQSIKTRNTWSRDAQRNSEIWQRCQHAHVLFNFLGAVVDTTWQMLYETDTFGDLDLFVLSQLSHRPTDVWTGMILRHSHLQINLAVIHHQHSTKCKCSAETTTFCSSTKTVSG